MKYDLEGKNYMLMLDNGDGTCTSIISVPEANFEETTIIQIEFADILAQSVTIVMEMPEYTQSVIDRSTLVPNDLEGLEG